MSRHSDPAYTPVRNQLAAELQKLRSCAGSLPPPFDALKLGLDLAISPIRSAGVVTEPPKGTQRGWEPAAAIAFSIDWRSEAIVNSSAGAASSPPWIRRPVAPTEKVPETGLTPGVKAGDVGDVDALARLGEQLLEAPGAGGDDQVGGRRPRAASGSRRGRRWRWCACRSPWRRAV